MRTANHDLIAGRRGIKHEARIAYDELTRLEEKSWRCTATAILGAALAALHCYDEALNYSQISENIGALDDVINEICWRLARAPELAGIGNREYGE